MKHIKIAGVRYELKMVDGNILSGFRGKCDTNNMVISLDRGMSKERIFTTLIHEALHAVNHETGADKYMKDEEAYMEAVATVLAGFIRDNIGLLKKYGDF